MGTDQIGHSHKQLVLPYKSLADENQVCLLELRLMKETLFCVCIMSLLSETF